MSDLISRQDAIDALQKEINKGKPPFDDVIGSIRCGVRLARNIIEDLPPAQPERKKGKWTKENACEFCGFQPWYERDIHTLSFCPHCGADMRGEQE